MEAREMNFVDVCDLRRARLMLGISLALVLPIIILLTAFNDPVRGLAAPLFGLSMLLGIIGLNLAARALKEHALLRFVVVIISFFVGPNLIAAAVYLLKSHRALQSPMIKRLERETVENPALTKFSEPLQPVRAIPSLATVNTFGFKLYGKSDYDAGTDSFMANYYLVVLFVPVVPVARYRVVSPDNRRYRFIGQAKLRGAEWAHIAAVFFAAAVLLWGRSLGH